MPSRTLDALVLAGAVAAAALAVSRNVRFEALETGAERRERCYGVVRAGRNDCATTWHSCAAQSVKDGDPESWVMVPEGLCARLAGGRTGPGQAGAANGP